MMLFDVKTKLSHEMGFLVRFANVGSVCFVLSKGSVCEKSKSPTNQISTPIR